MTRYDIEDETPDYCVTTGWGSTMGRYPDGEVWHLRIRALTIQEIIGHVEYIITFNTSQLHGNQTISALVTECTHLVYSGLKIIQDTQKTQTKITYVTSVYNLYRHIYCYSFRPRE